MSEALYGQLLNIAAGALLLTAVLILWRRELASIIDVFSLQGLALATLVGLIALQEGSAELAVVAVGVLVLRAGVLPWLLRRALAGAAATAVPRRAAPAPPPRRRRVRRSPPAGRSGRPASPTPGPAGRTRR